MSTMNYFDFLALWVGYSISAFALIRCALTCAVDLVIQFHKVGKFFTDKAHKIAVIAACLKEDES